MYNIAYWYRDEMYNKELEGVYCTNSLTDVFAFCAMIKRCGGTCKCEI
jgi:hypothetical protein